jgi:hypothetical protein
MQVKNIVRKAVALGSGAALVGTTLMGALAYDLSTYPAKFIVDGKFDGKIIVGEKAATQDVLGSIDIAASLQGASVTKKPVSSGSGSTVTLSGDVKQIGTGSDRLELREAVGKVSDTLTAGDLQALKGGKLTTAEGSTDYSQYLRFNSNIASSGAIGSGNQLQEFGVNYIDNRDNKLGDYLVMEQTDNPVFEWQIQFSQGLKSKRATDGRLRDMEDRTLNILGTDFNIVTATVGTAGTDFQMTLMGGSVPDTLREGETKTYTINGVDYEVTLVFVSDPASGSSAPEVKLSVNGEITKAMQRGDTDTLSGGLQIGIRDILVNAREGVASFYLGADKITFGPTATATDAFQTGKVSINNQNINQAQLAVRGDFYSGSTDKFELTSIKYRLKMDASTGSDVYITKGHGLRENLRYPQGLISPTLDIKYEGLTEPQIGNLALQSRGNDQYDLQFTNLQNQAYDLYLVSNRQSVFKFGSDKDDLVFVEAANTSLPNIGLNDYFVTSDSRSDVDKAVTNVLRYEDIDTTNKIMYFTDVGNGGQRRDVTYTMSTALTGSGDLVVGGHTFRVYVENGNSSTGTHRVAVDLNADGDVANDSVSFTVLGGGVLSLTKVMTTITNSTNATWYQLSTGTQLSAIVGDSKNISGSITAEQASTIFGEAAQGTYTLSNATLYWSLQTLAKNFDTSGNGSEYINWTVSPTTVGSNAQVTLGNVVANGPLMQPSSSLRFRQFRFTTDRDDSVNYKGMSDFGVSILENVPNSGNNPNSLTLGYPAVQRFPQVFVVGGTTTSSTSTSGNTIDVVNPIAVGLAILDRDAQGMIGKENLIVVGGPCANTIAAALLDNPANCGEGFEPGKAMIKAWDKTGTVAILVAGYEAQDTLGASRVLAAYKDYSLSGSEVEVVVADLNSIQVRKAGSTTTA